MELNRERRSLLWLSLAEITADRVERLREQYGSATAVWEMFGKTGVLSAHSEANAVLARFHSDEALTHVLENCVRQNVQILFREDACYPPLLECINDPPYLLYCRGNLAALRRGCVSIVGTRYPSAYGRDMARSLAFGLAKAGLCVVSGMARGIDACAHEGALNADSQTIAVLGCGVNVPYPPENGELYRRILDSGGLIISEYPLGAEPRTFHFPHRNRIISGLSTGLIFVEGRVKSGGMLTVGTALEQGREVFAVPGRVGQETSEGPLAILREGARIVTSATDVLEDLGVQPVGVLEDTPAAPDADASPMQRSIVKELRREPLSLDELCEHTGAAADELMVELSEMEILGRVRREGGNRFSLSLR